MWRGVELTDFTAATEAEADDVDAEDAEASEASEEEDEVAETDEVQLSWLFANGTIGASGCILHFLHRQICLCFLITCHAILQADVRDHFKLRCCDGVIDALRIPGCCPWRILHFVLFFHGFHHRSLQGLKLKPWRRKSSLGNLDESMNMVENDNNTSFDIFSIMLEIESTPTERDWLHCPQDRSFFTKETGWLIGLATWQFPKVVRGRRKHITCKIQINRYKWCEMDVWWRPR